MPRRGPGMAGQRWEKKLTDVRAGAQGQPPASPLSGSASQPRGLGPELFHTPSLNVPASPPLLPRLGVHLGCASLHVACLRG